MRYFSCTPSQGATIVGCFARLMYDQTGSVTPPDDFAMANDAVAKFSMAVTAMARARLQFLYHGLPKGQAAPIKPTAESRHFATWRTQLIMSGIVHEPIEGRKYVDLSYLASLLLTENWGRYATPDAAYFLRGYFDPDYPLTILQQDMKAAEHYLLTLANRGPIKQELYR